LGDFGFGWMKVVFEWWVMFGMMFGSVLVKKFCELVEFGGRYEGLKVVGYGVFREMFMWYNEGRRRRIFVLFVAGIAHGRANIGTGRANLL